MPQTNKSTTNMVWKHFSCIYEHLVRVSINSFRLWLALATLMHDLSVSENIIIYRGGLVSSSVVLGVKCRQLCFLSCSDKDNKFSSLAARRCPTAHLRNVFKWNSHVSLISSKRSEFQMLLKVPGNLECEWYITTSPLATTIPRECQQQNLKV